MGLPEGFVFSLTRRGVLLAALAVPTRVSSKPVPCTSPRVLFVCPAGTVKSAIAREVLRQRARSAGVPVRVTSRGLVPEDHVSPELASRLRADGIDPAVELARALSAADATDADIVIAYDAAADSPLLVRPRAWAVPSWNADYVGAQTALAQHIEALLAELKARPCPQSEAPRG